jgi:hypothetical protein
MGGSAGAHLAPRVKPFRDSPEARDTAAEVARVVARLKQEREAFLARAAEELGPALNAYLRANTPEETPQAKELAKSLGETLRGLHLAVRGTGEHKDRPCALEVNLDSAKQRGRARFSLRFTTPIERPDGTVMRHADLGGKSCSYVMADLLPITLTKAAEHTSWFQRWADRVRSTLGRQRGQPNTEFGTA